MKQFVLWPQYDQVKNTNRQITEKSSNTWYLNSTFLIIMGWRGGRKGNKNIISWTKMKTKHMKMSVTWLQQCWEENYIRNPSIKKEEKYRIKHLSTWIRPFLFFYIDVCLCVCLLLTMLLTQNNSVLFFKDFYLVFAP